MQEATGTAAGAVESVAPGGDQLTVREELREIVRETALEILVPVARRATLQAAKYAIARGPQLARDTIAPKLTETVGGAIESAGGPEAFARSWLTSVVEARSGMLEKVGIGRESHPRSWRERRLPVEESIDVVVPLETAYDRFGEYEEYARIMSRGETVDERPNERIAWERTDRVEASAVITFHRLSDRLTRVMVTYDRDPHGLFEQTTSLFRTPRRGLTADLMRFKAFAEMTEESMEAPDDDLGEAAEAPGPRQRPQARRAEPKGARGEHSEGEDEAEEMGSRPTRGGPARRRAAARPRPPKARRG